MPAGDAYVALAETHEGLPRPGRDLDCRVLRAPDAARLLLLAAIHHTAAYYLICILAERSTWTALNWVQKLGRLQLGFTTNGTSPTWSALDLDEGSRGQLAGMLRAQKQSRHLSGESWRDRLGRQLLELPGLFTEVEPRRRAALSMLPYCCLVHAPFTAAADACGVPRLSPRTAGEKLGTGSCSACLTLLAIRHTGASKRPCNLRFHHEPRAALQEKRPVGTPRWPESPDFSRPVPIGNQLAKTARGTGPDSLAT